MEDRYKEKAVELRSDPSVHYNCAQSVLIPFAEACGITEEQAAALGAHFGGGMRMGSVCGAIAGGAMVIGMLGGGDAEYRAYLEAMREDHGGAFTCADLLAKAGENGIDRKSYCDGLVFESVENIQNYIKNIN